MEACPVTSSRVRPLKRLINPAISLSAAEIKELQNK